jgi:hypothetical protein
MKNYRKIYETYHQVKLDSDIDVHHIDGNRNNNNIDNLIAVSREEHIKIHLAQGDYWSANLLSKGKVDVSGERNPMHGTEPWNKGKTGFIPWNLGISGYKNKYPPNVKRKVTEKGRKARSQSMKKVWDKRKEDGVDINRSVGTGCKGYKWYNNGEIEICINDVPPEHFIPGRIKGIPRGEKRK